MDRYLLGSGRSCQNPLCLCISALAHDRAKLHQIPTCSTVVRTHIPLLHIRCMDFDNDDHEPVDDDGHFVFPETQMLPGVKEPGKLQASYRPDVIAKLVAASISPNLKWGMSNNGQEFTALLVAVQHLNVQAVKALLKAGADPHACNSRGRNVLMVAVGERAESAAGRGPGWGDWMFLPCSNRNEPLPVKFLVDAGIQINHRDSDGDTALHLLFADQARTYAWIEEGTLMQIFLVLLARGADPFLRNNAGETAFQLAARHQAVYAMEIKAKQGRID
jgi:hypothetical protein